MGAKKILEGILEDNLVKFVKSKLCIIFVS